MGESLFERKLAAAGVTLLAAMVFSGCFRSLDSVTGVESSAGADIGLTITKVESTAAGMLIPAYEILDRFAVPAAILSFVFGIILLVFFERSKSKTRIAVFAFMLCIPFALIVSDIAISAWLSNNKAGEEAAVTVSKTLYDNLVKETGRTAYAGLIDTVNPLVFITLGYNLYCGGYGILIALSSFAVGFVLRMTIKNSKTIKDISLKVMMIGIPVVETGLMIACAIIGSEA